MMSNVHGLHVEMLDRLFRLTKALSADMARGLSERGLTQTRAHLLWELGTRPSMNQRELADVLGVTPRNVTTLIDALERTGFVNRLAHPNDRRSTVIMLSELGKTAVLELKADRDRFADLLFGAISSDDLDAFGRVAEHAIRKMASLDRGHRPGASERK